MTEKNTKIIIECEREEENCLYTSTTFYMWLSSLKRVRKGFISIPILLGGIASMEILTVSENNLIKYIIAVATLFAGVLPSIFSALKIETDIKNLDQLAGKYKVLQGRFRRLRTINFLDEHFEEEFNKTIQELEKLKLDSPAAPERFFAKASKKIDKGHYDFAVDNKN